MFGTVIVPLDGSAHAEAAIPYAIDEARRHNAELVLAHVVFRPEPCPTAVQRRGPSPPVFPWPTSDGEQKVRRAKHYLAETVERYGLGPNTRGVVLVGELIPRILVEASQHDRPVIVLTTGDASGDEKPPVSEIARRLMLNGTVPVLAVRFPPTTDCRDTRSNPARVPA